MWEDNGEEIERENTNVKFGNSIIFVEKPWETRVCICLTFKENNLNVIESLTNSTLENHFSDAHPSFGLV